MARYVRETAAGQSISAWVIFRGKRRVATVQAHYSNGGRVLVNVWQEGEASERSERAAKRDGEKLQAVDYGSPMEFQQGAAGGYGYDKFAAAMRGLYIDGHRMTDHSSRYRAPKPPKGRRLFPADYKPPRGYSLANYVAKEISFGFNPERHPNPNYAGEEGYGDCYRLENLRFLEAAGYTVVKAI